MQIDKQSVPRKHPLTALTGLRFLAALYVIAFHFAPKNLRAANPLIESFIATGYTAVSFFFILSGFVLAYSYINSTGSISVPWRTFWLARFARIYPAYLLGLALMTPKFVSDMMDGGVMFLRAAGRILVFGGISAGLLQAWWPKTALLWNFPGWSLSVEAFFYLLFPFLAASLLSRWRTPWALLTAMAMFWVLSQAPPILYLLLDPETLGSSSPAWSGLFTGRFDGFWMRLVRFHPLLHVPEFLIGMCLGKLFLLRPGTGGGLGAFASLAGLCTALAYSPLFPFPMLHNGLLAPIACILIYSFACGGGFLGRLLSTGPFQLLGEASYSMYILQIPVWMGFSRIIGAEHPRGMAEFLAYVALLIVVSILVLRFIEMPGRELLKKRFGKRKPKQGEQTAVLAARS